MTNKEVAHKLVKEKIPILLNRAQLNASLAALECVVAHQRGLKVHGPELMKLAIEISAIEDISEALGEYNYHTMYKNLKMEEKNERRKLD